MSLSSENNFMTLDYVLVSKKIFNGFIREQFLDSVGCSHSSGRVNGTFCSRLACDML
jgi:hypothetical protein